jgi:hypothetical protein
MAIASWIAQVHGDDAASPTDYFAAEEAMMAAT